VLCDTGAFCGVQGNPYWTAASRWRVDVMTDTSSYLNRWLSPDTIVPDLANPQSLNRYSYVNNRPLNFTDPTGHFEDDALSWTLSIQLPLSGITQRFREALQ
jgi:hypothetical protein